jgi:hypothetical protein
VDYLTEAKREQIRELSRRWLIAAPSSIDAALKVLSTEY